MYNFEITTPYNVIYLTVDNPNDPDLVEILEQPWVIDVKYWRVLEEKDENCKFKRLRRVKWNEY